jgi:SH3-like domain-containing protein
MTKKRPLTAGYIEIKLGGFYHVREKNSQFAKSFGVPKKGERIAYLGETDLLGWHKVYYKGQIGWLYKQAGPLTVVEQKWLKVKKSRTLWRVRSAPDSTAKVLGHVSSGDKLLDQGETKNNYRLVVFNNQNGWIHNRAIEKE